MALQCSQGPVIGHKDSGPSNDHQVDTSYCECSRGNDPAISRVHCLTQNGRYNTDIFKCIFLNENVWFPTKISLKFVPKGPINNIQALVLIMAWRRPGDKPLSEPMMVRLPTHICVTQPQWVNSLAPGRCGSNSKSVTLEDMLQI